MLIYHVQHWLQGPGYAANAGLAVDLFFCLSGFVLANAYGRRIAAGMSLADFLRSRLIRLMPLVAVATIVSASYVLAHAFQSQQAIPRLELGAAFFLGLLSLPFFGASPEIGGPQLFPLNGPQYTIWLELFVNILWHLTCRVRWRGVNYVIAGVSLFCLSLAEIGGDTAETFWSGLPRVVFSFYTGVILFTLSARSNGEELTVFGKSVFWVSFILMLVIFALPVPYLLPLPMQLVWIALISPALVVTAARLRIEGRLVGVSAWLGAISYPVYILHYPVFCWVNGAYQFVFRTANFTAELVLLVIVLLVACMAALRLIDEPLRAVLSAWGRRRAVSVAQSCSNA